MNERKILLFILSLVIYCMYSVNMWYTKHSIYNKEKTNTPDNPITVLSEENAENPTRVKKLVKTKVIPLVIKDACSVLQVFAEKPQVKLKNKKLEDLNADNNTITVICIIVFLVILVLNAILDVLKVKEEERARKRLNPNEERRQSLSEFANKKTLRRESSKFSLQLFQIAESFVSSDEDKKNRRQNKPYTRGESINSYLSDRKIQKEGSAPASVSETPVSEPRLVKRQSVAKLFGLSDD